MNVFGLEHEGYDRLEISVVTRDTMGSGEIVGGCAIQRAEIISCFVNSAPMSNFQYNGCCKKLA